jgi:aquaporin Z
MNPILVFFTEIIGTFILIATILMTNGNALAIGLALAVAIYIGANVSGGHFNPAVSVVMYLKNSINTSQLLFYIIAQLFGGLFALSYYSASSSNSKASSK